MKIVITQLFQGVYLCSSNYFHTMKYYHVGFMVIGNQFADARDAAKMLCGLRDIFSSDTIVRLTNTLPRRFHSANHSKVLFCSLNGSCTCNDIFVSEPHVRS